MVTEAANHNPDSNGVMITVNPEINDSSPFGPWMMVRRIPRLKGKGFFREGIKNGSDKEIISPNINGGSRFNALETEDVCGEDEDLNVQNYSAMKEPCNFDTAPRNDKAKGTFGSSQVIKIRNSKGRSTIDAPSSSSKPDRSLMKEIEKLVLLRMKDLERINPNLLDKVSTQVHYSSPSLQNPLHGFSPTINEFDSDLVPPIRDGSQPVSIQSQTMEIDGCSNTHMEETTQPISSNSTS
ncbi:hypothetical protein RIF29_25278 [Crotalaria pallida]|uniref:Uncharacterized protein n=1 Tax=Crotalaria pallida TaxID=3830 RepID=A0AAN9ER96_CROPI